MSNRPMVCQCCLLDSALMKGTDLCAHPYESVVEEEIRGGRLLAG